MDTLFSVSAHFRDNGTTLVLILKFLRSPDAPYLWYQLALPPPSQLPFYLTLGVADGGASWALTVRIPLPPPPPLPQPPLPPMPPPPRPPHSYPVSRPGPPIPVVGSTVRRPRGRPPAPWRSVDTPLASSSTPESSAPPPESSAPPALQLSLRTPSPMTEEQSSDGDRPHGKGVDKRPRH